MDEIFIDRLVVRCVIGVNDWERASRQTLLISLRLGTSIETAARNDYLAGTVDYVDVCRLAEDIAQRGAYRLIEALAERLAAAILDLDAVQRVEVCIEKPAAVHSARSVGVRIVRDASDGGAPRDDLMPGAGQSHH